MKDNIKYFYGSMATTVVGLVLGGFIGWFERGSLSGALGVASICGILAILEVSLSFDNAVVNATILRRMSPLWQHRFLTWGILVAVFGVRLVLPLAIVGIMAWINPWEALLMAATRPHDYAHIMESLHIPVAAFGGTFLIMVSARYFLDPAKDSHWLRMIEIPLSNLGRLKAIEVVIALIGLYLTTQYLPQIEQLRFFYAGIGGLILFLLVDGISSWLEDYEHHEAAKNIERASIGLFLYLEVLDASFSFDGVIGAFAITHNLFIICIGLGIGAMFVRSITIALVRQGTLSKFIFLEHGAFYAIGSLGMIMIADAFVGIPEAVTALLGVGFIGLSFMASIRHGRSHAPNSADLRPESKQNSRPPA